MLEHCNKKLLFFQAMREHGFLDRFSDLSLGSKNGKSARFVNNCHYSVKQWHTSAVGNQLPCSSRDSESVTKSALLLYNFENLVLIVKYKQITVNPQILGALKR